MFCTILIHQLLKPNELAKNTFIGQSIFWGLEVLSDGQSTNQLIPDQSHDRDSCLFWSPKTHSSQDQKHFSTIKIKWPLRIFWFHDNHPLMVMRLRNILKAGLIQYSTTIRNKYIPCLLLSKAF